MFLAVDVHYRADRATAAGVAFDGWKDAVPHHSYRVLIDRVRPYVPGRFYERELPCILALLDQTPRPEVIVIDGYVTLGPDQRDGLGAHLFRALDEQVAVIGVAKTAFRETPPETELFRGNSARPIYVTAMGIAAQTARDHILGMHGSHRIPTLLRNADQLCRA